MLKNFEKSLEQNAQSPKTIKSYLSDLRNLMSRNMITEDLRVIDFDAIKAYKVSNRSKRRWVASIRKYAKFLVFNGMLDEYPKLLGVFELPVTRRVVQDVISSDELKNLLTLDTDLQTKVILHILTSTACRIESLAELRVEDIQDDYIIFRKAKGGKPYFAYLTKAAKTIINEYIAINNIDGYLFTMDSGEKLSEDAIRMRLISRLKTNYVNPHKIRASVATALLENGAELVDVKDFLNHSDVHATMHYINLSPKLQNKRIESHHPMD